MTNKDKRVALAKCDLEKFRIAKRIDNTQKELARARLWYEVYLRRVDKLENRLARQQREYRHQLKIEQSIINGVDEYDEFYLLANEMTA